MFCFFVVVLLTEVLDLFDGVFFFVKLITTKSTISIDAEIKK